MSFFGRNSFTEGGFGRSRKSNTEFSARPTEYGGRSNNEFGARPNNEFGARPSTEFGRSVVANPEMDSNDCSHNTRGGFSRQASSRGTSWGFTGPREVGMRPASRNPANFPPPPRDAFGGFTHSHPHGGFLDMSHKKPNGDIFTGGAEKNLKFNSTKPRENAFDSTKPRENAFNSVKPRENAFNSFAFKQDNTYESSKGIKNIDSEKPNERHSNDTLKTAGGFGRGRRGLPNVCKTTVKTTDSNIFMDTADAMVYDSANTDSSIPSIHRTRLSSYSEKSETGHLEANKNVAQTLKKSTLGSKSSSSDMEFETQLDIDSYKIGIVSKDGSTFDNNLLKEWKDAGFSNELENHIINKLKFEKPTTIQSIVIPMITKGRDVIFQSVTGNGKLTAIFLPIINNLMEEKNRNGNEIEECLKPKIIVISPTFKVTNDRFTQFQQLCEGLEICVKRTICLNGKTSTEESISNKKCDVLCTNFEDLKRYVIEKMISFDDLKFVIVEQAERIEQNFLNLIRFVRHTSGFPNASVRHTIICGTCVSPQLHELAVYILRDDFFFVHMKRDAPSKDAPRCYTKEHLLKMLEESSDPSNNLKILTLLGAKASAEEESSLHDVDEKLVKTSQFDESTDAFISKPPNGFSEVSNECLNDHTSKVPNQSEVKDESVLVAAEKFSETPKTPEKFSLSVLNGIDTNAMADFFARNSKKLSSETTSSFTNSIITNASTPSVKLISENATQDLYKISEFEKTKAQNKILLAENARLTQHIRVLEEQLTSVVNFFGNFLAKTNISKYSFLMDSPTNDSNGGSEVGK